jgi:hypothetical protein
MNLLTSESSDEYFGGPVPDPVRVVLDQAKKAPVDERRRLLWSAHALDPTCLPVCYLLYKFHAGRRDLVLAEQAARLGLMEAARQAGIDPDWRAVTALPPVGDETAPALRFWLFTLKALAFITLRAGRADEARDLLATIRRLAPEADVGQGVIEALVAKAGR